MTVRLAPATQLAQLVARGDDVIKRHPRECTPETQIALQCCRDLGGSKNGDSNSTQAALQATAKALAAETLHWNGLNDVPAGDGNNVDNVGSESGLALLSWLGKLHSTVLAAAISRAGGKTSSFRLSTETTQTTNMLQSDFDAGATGDKTYVAGVEREATSSTVNGGLREWARLANGLGLRGRGAVASLSNTAESTGAEIMSARADQGKSFQMRIKERRRSALGSGSVALPGGLGAENFVDKSDNGSGNRDGEYDDDDDDEEAEDEEATISAYDVRRRYLADFARGTFHDTSSRDVVSQISSEFGALLNAPSMSTPGSTLNSTYVAPSLLMPLKEGDNSVPSSSRGALTVARIASIKVRQPNRRQAVGERFVKWLKTVDEVELCRSGLLSNDSIGDAMIDDAALLYEAAVRAWYICESASQHDDAEAMASEIQQAVLGRPDFDRTKHAGTLSKYFQFRSTSTSSASSPTTFASNQFDAAKLSVRRGVHHYLDLLQKHAHPHYCANDVISRQPTKQSEDEWNSWFLRRERQRCTAALDKFVCMFPSSLPQALTTRSPSSPRAKKEKKFFLRKPAKSPERQPPHKPVSAVEEWKLLPVEPPHGSAEASLLRLMDIHGHRMFERFVALAIRFCAQAESGTYAFLPRRWEALIMTFSLIYGISDSFVALTFVKIAASSFDHTTNQLQSALDACRQLQLALSYPTSGGQVFPLRANDLSSLRVAIQSLLDNIQTRIQGFAGCFPPDDEGKARLRTLLALLRAVLELQTLLAGNSTPASSGSDHAVADAVSKCLRKAVSILYHGFAMRAGSALELPESAVIMNPNHEANLLLVGDLIVQLLADYAPASSDDQIALHYFKDEFSKCKVNIIGLFATELRCLFAQDLVDFAERVIANATVSSTPEEPVLSPTMLELFDKASEVDVICGDCTGNFDERIPLGKLEPIVVLWINQLAPLLAKWVQHSISVDTWSPIALGDGELVQGTQIPASSCVLDLFSILSAPLRIIRRPGVLLCECEPARQKFLVIYRSVVETCIGNWCESLVREATQLIPAAHRPHLKSFFDAIVMTYGNGTTRGTLLSRSLEPLTPERTRRLSSSEIVRRLSRSEPPDILFPWHNASWPADACCEGAVSRKMCMLISNAEAARDRLAALADDYDGLIDWIFVDAFQLLRVTMWRLAGILIYRVNTFAVGPLLVRALSEATGHVPGMSSLSVERTHSFAQLLRFLDQQMEVMVSWMFGSVFLRTTKLLWEVIMCNLADLILRAERIKCGRKLDVKSRLREALRSSDNSVGGSALSLWLHKTPSQLLEPVLDGLLDLFYADGDGISLTVLEKGSMSFVRTILTMSDIDSQSLVELHESYSKLASITLPKNLLVTASDIQALLVLRKGDAIAEHHLARLK